MHSLILKVKGRLYREKSFVHSWRSERMLSMVRLLGIPKDARVIDLGGSEFNWNLFDNDFHVTLVNLPGSNPPVSDPARFTAVDGSACDLKGVFADNVFDLAFSNSTIEHVGGAEEQARFAAEARRLAPAYWVQTPSSRFPIEIHTGVPLYWKLPERGRKYLLRSWQKKLPAWTDMIRETRILTEPQLKELFPDGKIYREKKFGFEKSYSLYRPFPSS
jgi:hypothetical protein